MNLASLRRWIPVRPSTRTATYRAESTTRYPRRSRPKPVLKMVMRIDALEWGEGTDHMANSNSLSRYIAVKEQHADLVKHEVDILWHRTTSSEHLEKYPDLHTTVWDATKLASANKQNVDAESAARLPCSFSRRNRGDILGHQGRGVRRPELQGTVRHLGPGTRCGEKKRGPGLRGRALCLRTAASVVTGSAQPTDHGASIVRTARAPGGLRPESSGSVSRGRSGWAPRRRPCSPRGAERRCPARAPSRRRT